MVCVGIVLDCCCRVVADRFVVVDSMYLVVVGKVVGSWACLWVEFLPMVSSYDCDMKRFLGCCWLVYKGCYSVGDYCGYLSSRSGCVVVLCFVGFVLG